MGIHQMRRRWILAVGLIVAGTIATVILLWLQNSAVKKMADLGQTEPEKGGPQTVALQNTERLNELLTAAEYNAVRSETSQYILKYVGGSVEVAKVEVGSTIVNTNSSIDFTVTTDHPQKSIDIELQRPTAQKLLFTVPAAGFTQELRPYPQN